MNIILPYLSSLWHGSLVTLGAWIVAGSCSIILGFILGILSSHYCATTFSASIIRLYTFIAKGIPAYVQILIAYFVLPSLIGLDIPGFYAATGALAFCSSGYITEIVRAGMNSIPPGQWQATIVLGYSRLDALRRIMIPQTIKTILPALFGELEQLLKSTSLLATVGITELTRTGMNIISRELNPLPIYLTIAGIYLIISALLQASMYWSERMLSYDNH